MNRLEQLYQKLGINKENGLFLQSESNKWIHQFPYRIGHILKDVIRPAAFFCLFNNEHRDSKHPKPFNQPFILFFEDSGELEEELIHKRVINFGLAQAVFISRAHTLDLYHGTDFSINTISKHLRKVRTSSTVDNFEDLSFINLLRGKSVSQLDVTRNGIDTFLLNNITDARRILVAKNGLKLPPKAANRLIGRLLFIRYLIDRDVTFTDQSIVIGNNKQERRQSFHNLIVNKTSLYKFFHYLTDKYNGDMFPLIERKANVIEYDEEAVVNKSHLEILFYLFTCSKFFKTGAAFKGYTVQISLFDLYDFEIIPVELISSIYENFIGNEYENEKVNLTKQKEIKAYYTPSYIVDYVLSQTVTPFLGDINKKDSACKVLDPSCGSGIFLVETVRKIIEKEILISKRKISDSKLWKLIKSNIYGIDIDPDAIDISIFSLYVTILDYKEPAEIENFKFEKLKEENFFGGNTADFFNTEHQFNKTIKGLDFIIGNPPWGTVKQSRYIDYIEERNLLENGSRNSNDQLLLGIGDKEISQAFLIRTSDFATEPKTPICSLIVSSKVLYNSGAKEFRNYFLKKSHIKQVVELSPVNNKIRGGNHIFDKARQPACIITFIPEKGNVYTGKNIVQHITVKPNRYFLNYKTIVIEKHDVKNVEQRHFIESEGGFDWMWRVLVHGNALDFHFLKRLKKKFDPVSHHLKERGYEAMGGLKLKDGTKKNDTIKLLNFHYLDAENEFRPFIAKPKKKWSHIVTSKKLTNRMVGFLPETKFFEGDKLLIKKGLVLKPRPGEHLFGAVSAFHSGNVCFTDTVFSIIAKIKNQKNSDVFLGALSGIFNSKIFTYFLLNSSSAAGIERSIVRFSECFDFPLKISDTLGRLALNITNKFDDFEDQVVHKSKKQIEKLIYENYELDRIEKSLIDFAMDVSIPILLRDKYSLMFSHLDFHKKTDVSFIFEYIDSFAYAFRSRVEQVNKRFKFEIIYSDDFIRINFHLIPASSITETVITRSSNKDLELMMGDLGVYNVCKELFMQQDVRGFTKSSFYIIKPNERKLWHNAIGYLDSIEIDDEITRTENKQLKMKTFI